ncbi:MAG: hypothetical protein RJB39_207 [Candidatus Parcubacteria bacterium]
MLFGPRYAMIPPVTVRVAISFVQHENLFRALPPRAIVLRSTLIEAFQTLVKDFHRLQV